MTSKPQPGCIRHAWPASSTALSLLAAMGVVALSGQAAAEPVIVGAGHSISIPGDHDPLDVDHVSVVGGTLETSGAIITGELAGAENDTNTGLIEVRSVGDNHGTATLVGGTITNTTSSNGNALFATGAGSSIIASGITLEVSGKSTGQPSAHYGARIDFGAHMQLNNAIVDVSGNFGYGIGTTRNNSSIVATNITITTTGNRGHGIQAFVNRDSKHSTSIIVDGGSVTTSGIQASAINANNLGSSLEVTGMVITTSGDEAHGALTDRGGSLTASNSSITTESTAAHGLFASFRDPYDSNNISAIASNLTADKLTITAMGDQAHGAYSLESNIALTNTEITIEGSAAIGAYAKVDSSDEKSLGSSSLTFTDGSIISNHAVDGKDSGSHALLAEGSGATIHASAVAVETLGQHSYGVYALDGGEASLSNLPIYTEGNSAHGAYALDGSIGLSEVDITTNGAGAIGAYVKADAAGTSSLTFTGGSIFSKHAVDGEDSSSHALLAEGSGATINVWIMPIETSGQHSFGAYALDGGDAALFDLAITTEGNSAHGAYALDGSIGLSEVDITINAAGAIGAYARTDAAESSSLTITGGSIISNHAVDGEDSGSHALLAEGGGATIDASNVVIATSGQNSHGAYALDGGQITLSNLSIDTEGYSAHGILASGENSKVDASIITITTDGGSDGIIGESSDGLIAADGGQIVADWLELNMAGDHGRALVAIGSGGMSRIELTNSDIEVAGANSMIGHVTDGNTLSVTNSTLIATEGGGIALKESANLELVSTTIDVAGARLLSEFSLADQVQNISFSGTADLSGNGGALLSVSRSGEGSNGIVNLTIGSITGSGDILDEGTRTGDGATHLTLQDGANWTGAMSGIASFSLAGGASFTSSTPDEAIGISGNVNVDESSTLNGKWAIAGKLASSGTIAPGNSIGTIETGSLELTSDSVYEVEINSAGEWDLIQVTGAATLDGKVIVTPIDGYLLDTPYLILTADSISGNFTHAEIDLSSVFLSAQLDHGTQDVQLTIERSDVAFAAAASTANEIAVANALESLPLDGTLLTGLGFTSLDELAQILGDLSGEVHASVLSGLISASLGVRNTVSGRIREAFGATTTELAPILSYAGGGEPLLADAASEGPVIWKAAGGWRASMEPTGNSTRFESQGSDFLIGIDGGDGSWRLGALAGYSHSAHAAAGIQSTAEADHIHLGLYGGGQWGSLGFHTGLAYSWSDIDTSRVATLLSTSETLTGSYRAGTMQIFGELGYRMDAGVASFEPFINLAHIRTRTEAFSETGGTVALETASSTTNTSFSTIGLRAAAEFGNATLSGTIGWRHAGGSINPTMTHSLGGSDQFTISGAPVARDAALVEAGMDIRLGKSAWLGVTYAGQFSADTGQHGVQSRLSVEF